MDGQTAWAREWSRMRREEEAFLQRAFERRVPLSALYERVPKGLRSSLNGALASALEATLRRSDRTPYAGSRRREARAAELRVKTQSRENRRNLQAPKKWADRAIRRQTAAAGAESVAMGLMGWGLPDLPVFTALLLRNLGTLAQRYGFPTGGRRERWFRLKLIETALSRGEAASAGDRALNRMIEREALETAEPERRWVEASASALADELLCLKFLQGVPVAGALGAVGSTAVLNRILEYAELKYRRRMLRALRRNA